MNALGQDRLSLRVAMAAGGTGGHMFPALALARALLERGATVALFTDRRSGGFGDALPEVETFWINAGGIAGTGLVRRARNVLRLGQGFLQARRELKSFGADAVVGFGGYASVPTLLAGTRLGARVLLHEQNAVLGRANRLLANRAQRVATSFEKTEAVPTAAAGKVEVTGNPVRPEIAALGAEAYRPVAQDGRIALLVVGGSLGARVFNDLVPAALERLAPDLRARLKVTQQVPGGEADRVAARYRQAGIDCELAPFFKDMAARLGAAQLVISRAGASTVAELAASGRPALMVPYPHATDDHQSVNASRLAEAGAGWLLPQASLSDEVLVEHLTSLLTSPSQLDQASRCALACAKPNAVAALAELVLGGRKSNGKPARDQAGDREEAAA